MVGSAVCVPQEECSRERIEVKQSALLVSRDHASVVYLQSQQHYAISNLLLCWWGQECTLCATFQHVPPHEIL